jgi:predicted MFS family arabinose efflux permease
MSTTAAEHSSGRRRSSRRRRGGENQIPVPREAWIRLAACTAAAALLQLDGTLITVALPNVAHSLSVSNSSTALVLSAFFVADALALFPGGRMVDRLGARHTALIGLGVFAVGALLGALSGSFALLCITRLIQGAGAGLVSPAALAGAVSGFPPERRGSALGIWGASAGLSNLVGPPLGGILTVVFDWRACWWALVPLALAAALGIYRYLPKLVHESGENGPGKAWNATVAAAAFVAGLTFAVMIGTFYLAEQYLQKSVGYSALGASAVLIIVAFLVGAGAPVAGMLVDQRGERTTTILGFAGLGIGMALLAIPAIGLHSILTVILLIPVGLGLGMLFVPVSRAALNSVPERVHGRTSSILSFARLAGAAIGGGLAGAALASGVDASKVHLALAISAALCLFAGIPAGSRFGHSAAPAERAAPATDGQAA